ncbi:hypothetical protein ABS71_02425 [bacterium SCN 62-11]|mgnify:CR=1 FL=1|nr:HAD-IIIC family phosphatase [Candidatus Eremiobacteraeota bacterium]ODT77748.1 MAG: hypothetical protein ABS71_02425 [bacterium SCN 62-11]
MKPTLVVASTFVAEPLRESLEFWTSTVEQDWQLKFAPSGQLFQQLLDPTSALRTNHQGVNVLLVRLDDWRGSGHLQENLRTFEESLRAAVEGTPRYLVVLCPSQSDQEENLPVLPAVSTLLPQDYLDPYSVTGSISSLGPIPYHAQFFTALGTAIVRRLQSWSRPPCKVVVVDCDQTLWLGACAEGSVQVTPAHQAFQAFLIEQTHQGRLLCLASKNAEADVWAVFDQHPDMLLQRTHLASARINWQPKSSNLRELAQELNFGLDTFLFLDDDAVEIAEVRSTCPAVTAVQLPESHRLAFLQHLWLLDGTSTTPRTQLLRDEAERQRLRAQAPSLAAFIAQLGVQVAFSPLADGELARAAELSLRTTQMHLAPRAWSEPELAMRRTTGICVGVHCQDRLGDYGLVGLLCAHESGEVDGFMLSCRALGRGVEHRMLAWLGQQGQQQGWSGLRLKLSETARNLPARQFVASLGGPELSVSQAAEVRWRPQNAVPAPTAAVASIETASWDSLLMQRIAEELTTAETILRSMRLARGARPELCTAYAAPQNETERELAALLGELLRVDPVGRNDSFYDLGGHSLLAAQVLSLIEERLHVQLSPIVLFRGPFTVAELAQTVHESRLQAADEGELLEVLSELDDLSDEEVRALLLEGS